MKIVNIFIFIICMYHIGTCQIVDKSEILKVSKQDLGISNEQLIDGPNMFSFNTYQSYNLDEFTTSLPFDDISRYTLFIVLQQDREGEFAMINSDKKALNISSGNINGIVKKEIKLKVGEPHILMYKGSSGRSIKNRILKSSVQIANETRNTDFENQIHIADLIIYNKILNPQEIKIQESALSMQYSISLPKDSSYYSSIGNVVFDGEVNSPFNHRVTALGKDKRVNFSKLKSRNTNQNSILIGSVKNQLEDSQIFWSDNDMSIEFENNVLQRIWKLTHSGSLNQNLSIAFDLKQLEINSVFFDYFLIVSERSDFKEAEEYPLDINQDFLSGKLEIINDRYFTIKKKAKSNIDESGITMQFPNPSKIELKTRITLNSKEKIAGNLSIYTTNGQQIYTKKVELQQYLKYTEEVNFPMSGLYFISFSNDQVTITSKIFIL